MNPVLGSRKRFLYRVWIYGAAPLVGLYVFLDNPDDLRGRLIGGLAILVGATALLLLVTRLHDPWSAVRYAFRPVRTLREVLARWAHERSNEPDWAGSLRAHLGQQLPDLMVSAEAPVDDAALTLGEELTVVAAAPPQTSEERDGVLERIDALRSPLESRTVVVVFAGDPKVPDGVDLSMLEGARRIHIVRVGSEQPMERQFPHNEIEQEKEE